jgi:hypothetical protein
MSDDAFFLDRVLRRDWPPLDVQVPLRFPALSLVGAVFTAATDEATRLLPPGVGRLVEVMPGRCLVSLIAIEYRESDLGPYNELALTLPVSLGGAPLPAALGALGELFTRSGTAYVLSMPVTTARSLEVGVGLAGFPKMLADVRFRREASRVACEVEHDGRQALTLTADASDTPGRRRLKMRAVTIVQGVPQVSTFLLEERRWRDGLQRDTTRLELGAGPLAETLRALRLSSKPLVTHCASEARGMLFPPRNLDDD